MLALLPAILALAPSLAEWLSGPKAAAVTSQAVAVVQAITGSTDPEAIANLPPEKRAELQIRLAEIAAEQRKAEYADLADARARDITLRAAKGRNVRADVMVALCVVAIMAGMGFLASGLVASGSDAAGALIGLIGLFSKCFADAFQFEFGSSRGSADKTAATERLTTALIDRQPGNSSPIINQPSGTVVTGGTTDELNDASYRAARGG